MDTTAWFWVTVPIVFVFGALAGKTFSTGAKRIKGLKEELENVRGELEKTREELAETRSGLEQSRRESAEYHAKVTDHFVRAADLFNSLTVNYRAVYEHLAKSASTLCDEHMVMLSEGVPSERRIASEPPPTPGSVSGRPKAIGTVARAGDGAAVRPPGSSGTKKSRG